MYTVNGYQFETEEMAEKAKREINGIKYIKSQTRMDDPEIVYKLYNKLLDRNYFVTPVGLAFMQELNEYLHSIPFFREEDIRPVPVFSESVEQDLSELRKAVQRREKEKREKEKQLAKEAEREKIQELRKKRDEIEAAKRKQQQLNQKNYQKPFKITLFLSVVFGVIIIGMFLIMCFSRNNLTIINYENQIIDKYEAWEKELDQREQELREWEEQLSEREQMLNDLEQ